MRIAILGCGYVGSALAAELVRRGHDVAGTSTDATRAVAIARLGIRPAILELAQTDRLRALLRDQDAAVIMVAPSRPGATHETVYLQGIRHLLAAVSGTSVASLCYASSTSVYGQQDGSWVDETSPISPLRRNGQILAQAESELRAGAERLGIHAAILRLAGIVGPNRGPGKRIAQSAGQERADGEGYVNLVHRDDIVIACAALLERRYAGTLNLTDGRPVRRRVYYDQLIAAARLPAIRWVAPAPPAELGKRVSNRRIVELLKWTPRDAAAESVRDLCGP